MTSRCLLKRGLSATIKEFLLSAEYIMSRGNRNVMLCERGIRTFETQYRNTLDLAAIPTLKELSHLPVIVDPSHATGKWNLVAPMSKAAVAAGADGLLDRSAFQSRMCVVRRRGIDQAVEIQRTDGGLAENRGSGRPDCMMSLIGHRAMRFRTPILDEATRR